MFGSGFGVPCNVQNAAAESLFLCEEKWFHEARPMLEFRHLLAIANGFLYQFLHQWDQKSIGQIVGHLVLDTWFSAKISCHSVVTLQFFVPSDL